MFTSRHFKEFWKNGLEKTDSSRHSLNIEKKTWILNFDELSSTLIGNQWTHHKNREKEFYRWVSTASADTCNINSNLEIAGENLFKF